MARSKKKSKIDDNVGEFSEGKLYVVGTPIGNMGDITLRALDTLKLVDCILAEDTRQTLKLMHHYNIQNKLESYHKFNETEKVDSIIQMLKEGKNLALVSDAGMPRISDPGEILLKAVIEQGMKIEVVPGPTAITTAIVYSNLDVGKFAFEGFLNINNSREKKELLSRLKREERTIIFYEAPHKLLVNLKWLYKELGNRKICIARELTKIYEECIYTDLEKAIEMLNEKPLKGEIVCMLEATSIEEINNNIVDKYEGLSNSELVEKFIKEGMDKKLAIKKVAKDRDLNKNDVYMECAKNDR